MDSSYKPPPWVVITAALVLCAFLYCTLGSIPAIAAFFVAVAAFMYYQRYRDNRPWQPRDVVCLRCGATLSPTARNCNACGSASYTVRD
jgi:hypothetical protein